MRKYLSLFIIAMMLLVGCGGEPATSGTEETQQPNQGENAAVDIEPVAAEPEEADVSREYKNALKSAQNYISIMPFSKAGLYDQLTSEYGDQYPAEAAQYAIENVQVNYNEEALEAAKSYQEIMPMSDKELFNQLTSEHGDQFTDGQAQYAIDNLPE